MPDIRWNYHYGLEMAKILRDESATVPNYGDHWGDVEKSEELSQILNRFVLPFVDPRKIGMEIGCGGGRWTKYLLPFSQLICVELNPEMFSYIRRRFNYPNHLVYVTTHGTDLPLVPDSYVDYVFSFGTMVYLEEVLLADYVASLARSIRSGGDIVLQVADNSNSATRIEKPHFAEYSTAFVLEVFRANNLKVTVFDDEALSYSAVIHGVKL